MNEWKIRKDSIIDKDNRNKIGVAPLKSNKRSRLR